MPAGEYFGVLPPPSGFSTAKAIHTPVRSGGPAAACVDGTGAVEGEQASSSASGPASYASLVAGILERNKRYPRRALQNGEDGTVEAYFVVNRYGRIIGYRLDQRSGNPEIDAEVISLLKRVRFPPIPDDGGDPERREFTVPLSFRMKA